MAVDLWHFTDTAENTWSDTLVARARKRTVFGTGDSRWVVKGDKKLGDSKTHYTVTHSEDKGYWCSCYESQHGEFRRAKQCSHVVAVILGRADSPHPLKQEPGRALVEDARSGGVGRDDSVASAEGTGLPFPTTNAPGRDDSRWTAKWSEPLPGWLREIEGDQWQAVEETVAAFESGAKIVWLDGPPGTGKTLVGELVAREMQQRALYVCHSKSLQEQFVNDYPYAKVLKGRSNYLPQLVDERAGVTCADCTKQKGDPESCEWCESTMYCPYEKAKTQALSSRLAVINTAYLLNEANYIGNMSGRKLVIADECDTLEAEIKRFVELRVTPNVLNMLGVVPPQKGSHKTTVADWMMTELVGALKKKIVQLSHKVAVEDIKRKQQLESVLQGVERVGDQIEDDNWIRDNGGPLTFKPVKIDEVAGEYLWQHGEQWLCMSGTIISAEQIAMDLGAQEFQQSVVRVPMKYPVENRMIRVAPVANMVRKEQEEEWPKLVKGVRGVLGMHPGERVLIHTVSYQLAQYLMDHLGGGDRLCVTYTEASARDDAIARYRAAEGAVMIAPSLDRGVDFKGDDCRVVIVAKVPFPNLGDKQVSARMHTPGGEGWYAMQTARALVQSTQRAVRSMDDYCTIYILDKQFSGNFYKKSRGMLPDWWKAALDMRFDSRGLR